jgi:hypothetical protein
MSSPFEREYFAGGNESHPAQFHLTNLGFESRHVRNNESLYLSVAVFPTDYAMEGNQWATVKLNGFVIDAYCTPDHSCGKHWYTCVTDIEVSRVVSSEYGGSLHVEVSSFGVLPSSCDYLGYPLYAKVGLTEKSPHDEERLISVYYFLYATSVFFALMVVTLLIHIFIMKEKNVISVYLKKREENRRAKLYDFESGASSSDNPEKGIMAVVLSLILVLTRLSEIIRQRFSSSSTILPMMSEEHSDGVAELDGGGGGDLERLGAEVPWELRSCERWSGWTSPPPLLSDKPADKDKPPFVLADMDMNLLRMQSLQRASKARVLPLQHDEEQEEQGGGGPGGEEHEDRGKGFIETLESWDQLDDEHEAQLQDEEGNKFNVMSQYRQMGRVSTMSWLLNNDVDA